jgi:hypothetical protein
MITTVVESNNDCVELEHNGNGEGVVATLKAMSKLQSSDLSALGRSTNLNTAS